MLSPSVLPSVVVPPAVVITESRYELRSSGHWSSVQWSPPPPHTAGDNCCSLLKIVSTPPHQQPRHHPHCHAGTCHVSRGSTCVAAGMQTLTAAGGGVETLTPVSGLRDTATPTEGAEPAATPEPELGREEERWQRNFAKVSQYSEKTLVSVASAYVPFHIYESI